MGIENNMGPYIPSFCECVVRPDPKPFNSGGKDTTLVCVKCGAEMLDCPHNRRYPTAAILPNAVLTVIVTCAKCGHPLNAKCQIGSYTGDKVTIETDACEYCHKVGR